MNCALNNIGIGAMFLLNLKRRPERLAHALKQFENVGIKDFILWEAVDAKTLGLKSDLLEITPGMVGCYQSHRNIMKYCLDNNIDSYIVFEDDVEFIPGFNELCQLMIDTIPSDWEFVYWGSTEHLNGPCLKEVSDLWVVPRSVWGTQCFMMKDMQTIKKVYDALEKMQMQIDCQLSQLTLKQQQVKHYACSPSIVGQLFEIGSDIQQRNQSIQ